MVQHDGVLGVRAVPVVAVAVFSGTLLAMLWSYRLVDGLSERAASAVLGYDATDASLATVAMTLLFSFGTGLAGTCTACNVGVFGVIGPSITRSGVGGRPVFWLLAGLVPVAAVYGVIGTVFGSVLPQLSMTWIGGRTFDFPLRLVQSSVVFTALGLLYVAWGLCRLGVVRNPLDRLTRRYRHAETTLMGATIALYLVGRPFPLFIRLFEHVVDARNPALGSLAFALQGLGNVAVVSLFSLLLWVAGGRRIEKWLNARPQRARTVAAGSLLVAGTYYIVYWGVRLPLQFVFGS